MLKNLILLISVAAVSISAIASEPTVELSGFAFYRTFTDKSWHEDDAKLAVNMDIEYSVFSGSFQVAKTMDDTEDTVKRAVLSIAAPISNRSHIHLDYGRLPILGSFYNNATDSPSSAGMAILPMAGYNHRMNNGMFTLLDGKRIQLDFNMANAEFITIQYALGELYAENQEKAQREALRSYRSDVAIDPTDDTTALSIKYESKVATWFYLRNTYKIKTVAVQPNPVSIFLTTMFHDVTYDLQKTGVRLHNQSVFGQYEYTRGVTEAFSKTNVRVVRDVAEDQHIILGAYVSAYTSVYAGYAEGASESSPYTSRDKWIGVNMDRGDWVGAAEYHSGKGPGWMKYQAEAPYTWDSWVVSITTRF